MARWSVSERRVVSGQWSVVGGRKKSIHLRFDISHLRFVICNSSLKVALNTTDNKSQISNLKSLLSGS